MKYNKVDRTSNSTNHSYLVDENKRIIVHTGYDHSIDFILLLDLKEEKSKGSYFMPKGLWYLENIAEGEDCEVLNVDSLMIMIAQEEHGCVRA